MKIGIIDVGGGLRGSFGAGVLDYCLDNNIHITYGIGVSAGSANIASYFANQKERNLVFYTHYFKRWQYMSFKNFIHTGSYIGLDYIYSNLSNHDGDYPLKWSVIENSNNEFVVVTSEAYSGLPHYFTKNDMGQDHYEVIKASCCVPVINKPYIIDGIPYFDGGISDPIPYLKAFNDGCDKVIVILTRPKDFRRIDKSDKIIANLLKKNYPGSASAMLNRSIVYNNSLEECIKLEKRGKVCIIAPDSIGHMKTLTKDQQAIKELYDKGYLAGKKIEEFIK